MKDVYGHMQSGVVSVGILHNMTTACLPICEAFASFVMHVLLALLRVDPAVSSTPLSLCHLLGTVPLRSHPC